MPYDLNVPRALGRRCHSISMGCTTPYKKCYRIPPAPPLRDPPKEEKDEKE